jgi:hypothetical protein
MMDDGVVSQPRKRPNLDEVFGDVLPETISDERGTGDRGGDDRDRWYEENRPPHHEDR